MDYIYDIILNFQEEYYEFYEWQPTDKLINIKKIPIYKINTKDYLNIKNNITIIEKSTLPKQSKMFLLTNGLEVMGILIDNLGNVIKKSSLLFEEADDILTDQAEIKLINIKYDIKKIVKNEIKSRVTKEKIKYINNYLKRIDKQKDEYLLKYLYYEIYNLEENNIDNIYNHLLDLSKNNISKLYSCIQKVNLELKK